MPYHDLRDWIRGAEELGELRRVEGADWHLEIGAITEVAACGQASYAVLFDKIKGYPTGYRVLVGMNESLKRQCLTTNLPPNYDRMQFIQAWKERLNEPKLIPPSIVREGPILENIYEGKDIDLFSLPIS